VRREEVSGGEGVGMVRVENDLDWMDACRESRWVEVEWRK